jgi:hypothetical protein
VQVSDVYVRPDGRQLAALAQLLAVGRLSVLVAATHPLGQAAEALGAAVSGRAGGPVVLTMPPAVH